MMGAVLNVLLGAGVKLLGNLVSAWWEYKFMDRQLHSQESMEYMKMLHEHQMELEKDPFRKMTRRMIFIPITLTYCFLMVYYAMHPEVSYTILKPADSKPGILGFLFSGGSSSWETFTITGGLLLQQFVDVMFMIVGFYSMSGRKR